MTAAKPLLRVKDGEKVKPVVCVLWSKNECAVVKRNPLETPLDLLWRLAVWRRHRGGAKAKALMVVASVLLLAIPG